MEATRLFEEGFNCAQSVFVPFAVKNKIDQDSALKIMSAYGGGLSKSDNLCGAVTGGLAAIGLLFGHCSAEDTASKDKCLRISKEFMQLFKKECGSLYCTSLIGYNLKMASEAKKASDSGVFDTKCTQLVTKSTEIIESIIEKEL